MTIFLRTKTKNKVGIATYFSDSFVVAAFLESFLNGNENAQIACLKLGAASVGGCRPFYAGGL